ncbi:urease accessory protein D [Aplysia californica]|uniref:Urease accessory protein D n=1 Tax=Aplysia californica TaxID=6500 RepID=A0ABM0K8L8_APLCA|nr:urease accessory protein D [Aplysia californica]XP_035829066.1 urease accessory protein D [Aplysia californica]
MPSLKIVGSGHIEVEANLSKCQSGDKNKLFAYGEIVSLKYTHPFRFLAPENCTGSPCRWIYPVTFGGGLVGGDKVTAQVKVGAGCAVVVSSQESTKVYHCQESGETSQSLHYSVGNESLLCVLSDPVVCYKGANFRQAQVVDLCAASNLVFLDWMLSGRTALEEHWAFQRYFNKIEVQMKGEVVLRECCHLEDSPLQTKCKTLKDFQVCGTCIVLGDYVSFLSRSLQNKYGRKKDIGDKLDKGLIVSVSQVTYTVEGETINGCYLRFLAQTMSQASTVIKDICEPLIPILGADPFERKL